MTARPMTAGPAIASLLIPGLGQACQGRKLAALVHFALAVLAWGATCGTAGWVVNLCSAFGAAAWRARPPVSGAASARGTPPAA